MPHAIVLLKSPGGDLRAGLSIGAEIRLLKYSTWVASGHLCASACSLIWLGGVNRYMSKDSRIGFHAVYESQGGYKRESEMGNAIVGAYLTHLGLSLASVEYITAAGPNEMQWLNVSAARQLGIDVVPLDDLKGVRGETSERNSIPTQGNEPPPMRTRGIEASPITMRAVKAALKTIKNGGATSTRKAIVACYKRVREIKTADGAEYCYTFD